MKTIYALLALTTLISLTACKLTTYGGYIGSGVYHDDHYYHEWGNSHRNGWGDRRDRWNDNRMERVERDHYRRQTPGGNDGLRPPDRKIRGSMIMSMETAAPTSNFESSDERVITVADKYAISDYAATYIVRAIELAKANDASGIEDLGLTKKDFAKMMKGVQLEESKLSAVSAKLLMSTEAVEQMIFDIKNDIENAN